MKKQISFFKTYQCFIKGANHLQPILLFIIRIFWGYQFCIAGLGKLLNMGMTIEFFQSLNLPFPAISAALAAGTEFLGGICLIIGFFSRPASLLLAITMIVAYLTTAFDSITNLFSNPDDFIQQSPFMFLLASLIILGFGPGKLSIDHFIFEKQNANVS